MWSSRRSTRKSSVTSCTGFTAVELLLGVMLMGIAIAATSSMFVASKRQMQFQAQQLETTEAARAAIDMIVRDLRLGGACLPVTGDFISLDGTDNGQTDEIITRTGMTRPDLSCIRTSVPTGSQVNASGSTVPVQASDGFAQGMRAYIRAPDGTGEYFDVTGVASGTQLTKSQTLSQDYPATSGVYAIDERKFSIADASTPSGVQPQLMMQVGGAAAQSFAIGIEKLDVHYQLQQNCPPCDVVTLPTSDAQWAIVDSVLLDVTARSAKKDATGNYYRRTISVNVKPRNLLPR